MQQEVCSICQTTRLDASQWKNLSDEPNRVSLNQENNFNNPKSTLLYDSSGSNLCQAIELISGCKIDADREQVPLMLCDKCIGRLQTCVNLRAEIRHNLFRIFDDTSDAKNHSVSISTKWQLEDLNCHLRLVSPSKPDGKISHRLGLEPGIDILVNVDDNSKSPLIRQNQSIDENLPDDKSTEGTEDRDDKNFSSVYNGCESSDSSNTTLHLSKIQDTDLESEIDVCSGEDDEILELDKCPRRNETVNISSSSESEVEVCDYEPAGKRIKKYQMLRASVLL